MRHLLVITLAFLIFSCSSQEGSRGSGDLQLTILQDTVLIDSGEELVMAGASMFTYTLSPDTRFLYNYDRKSMKLEVFDLNQQALDKKVTFANDGPNAVSAYVMAIRTFPDGRIFMHGFDKSGLYDLEGNLTESVSLHPTDYFAPDAETSFSFKTEYVFLDEQTVLIGLMNMFEHIPYMAKLDLKEKTVEMIDFEYPQKMEKFSIILDGDGMKMASMGSVYKQKYRDKVLIHSDMFNETLVFDPISSDYSLIEYNSLLTPNEKVGGQKQKVSSREEFTEQTKILGSQVSFGRWVWDESTERFYRLSSIQQPSENQDGESYYKVVLTVFDKDLQMLGETLLPDYRKRPGVYFVKNGTIWIHENVDDELGFVRLKVG
ncbi:DUF4221 family protein [Mongoliitalea daihaiensis]|uniref:DUF4221 family protein n=1 Tax=Mongoliitalea daihaiensis TaxID=2782006 RepID=UPI001F44C168|nr:DUF4221 family protein [Mongoliitalea daihaiensis]UJP65876.1 DUF4221 family protein [Mongoliitalea daihaiensis]